MRLRSGSKPTSRDSSCDETVGSRRSDHRRGHSEAVQLRWGSTWCGQMPTVPWLILVTVLRSTSWDRSARPSSLVISRAGSSYGHGLNVHLNANAKYDEYFSPGWYVLGLTAFDHNYSQNAWTCRSRYMAAASTRRRSRRPSQADLKQPSRSKQQFMGTARRLRSRPG